MRTTKPGASASGLASAFPTRGFIGAATTAASLMTLLTAGTPGAHAEGLYRLDMRCVAPIGARSFHVVANVYSADTPGPGDLEGTAEADFDGLGMTNLDWDDVICITGLHLQDERLTVEYMVNGYDHGEFGSKTLIEILLDGSSSSIVLHTSCPYMIRRDHPYAADPFGSGTFYIDDGDGDCLYDHDYCPTGDRLYWLSGEFHIPCAPAGNLVLKTYRQTDDLRGVATADFDGFGLSGVFCCYTACITDAYETPDGLVVAFDAYGPKDHLSFYADSRFELEVGGCGSYYLDLHTSCSSVISLDAQYDLVPEGKMVFPESCGECASEGPTPIERSTWGELKRLFR